MAKQPPGKSKYRTSTRRDMSSVRTLGLRIALAALAVVLVIVLLLAFLVATGELALR